MSRSDRVSNQSRICSGLGNFMTSKLLNGFNSIALSVSSSSILIKHTLSVKLFNFSKFKYSMARLILRPVKWYQESKPLRAHQLFCLILKKFVEPLIIKERGLTAQIGTIHLAIEDMINKISI